MSESNEKFHQTYRECKLTAQVKALQYENKMLRDLVKMAINNKFSSHPGVRSEVGVTFSKTDFEAANDAEEFYEEDEQVQDHQFQQLKNQNEYYDEENQEQNNEDEENEVKEEEKATLDDETIMNAYLSSVQGNGDEDEELLPLALYVPKEKVKEEKKIEVEVDFEAQRQDMIRLYGEVGAKQIMAQEAKMQLQFDQLCDKNKPVLWPCLPLNMKFD